MSQARPGSRPGHPLLSYLQLAMRIPGFMHPPWGDDAIRAFPQSDDGASQMNGQS